MSAVTPRQLDAIREVVNIGAGHAATNLSELIGLRVMISVPRIRWIDSVEDAVPRLPHEDALVTVTVPMEGGDAGAERASIILARTTALRMVAMMLRRDPAAVQEMGELERSALQEMGNIVCAAYVGVFGEFLGQGLLMGTPEIREGPPAEMAELAGHGLLIETDFAFSDRTFEGVFVLTHSASSFGGLLRALGLDGAG